ncbi:hypothetical protein JOF56_005008 [Kibdelosporangium banguiense]|uniref:Uncharacterized protein n=1 Tax=Kibdelosporangium banguiense TaxID=1365924 RepID=A0ABS4TL41_9PSEU|nr:hypothetical protein [Kibdelosporangium banguiense]MBP2324623.1 hypothetical protein [Kibdelosporangium banguiense]
MVVEFDLTRVQRHPQAHLFGERVSGIVRVESLCQCRGERVDEWRFRQMSRSGDEDTVTPVFGYTLRPRDARSIECLFQCPIETVPHGDLVFVGAMQGAESRHIHNEDYSMRGRLPPLSHLFPLDIDCLLDKGSILRAGANGVDFAEGKAAYIMYVSLPTGSPSFARSADTITTSVAANIAAATNRIWL